MLLHGHAYQLFGHFHGDLVVADEQKLRLFAHAGYQLGVTLGVRIVEWGIDLIEQAKRCRVELEYGKHQRNRGQGFFATRQQMNGLVFLARRLRHDLHTGIQNLFACHHQLGVAAAKQLGEHLAKVLVHGSKGAGQQVARFCINLFDGIFKRCHGLVQVSRLRIQKLLALTRSAQLFECRQVDCA